MMILGCDYHPSFRRFLHLAMRRGRPIRGAAKRDVPLVLREGRCRARTAPLADSSTRLTPAERHVFLVP